MEIYAFGFEKGSGKDTSAHLMMAHIMQNSRNKYVMKMSCAYLLKKMASQMFPEIHPPEFYEEFPDRKNDYIQRLGKTVRQVWQDLGMKMREIDEDVHIDYVFNTADQLKADVLLIPDMRFKNEWTKVGKRKGRRILVDGGDRVVRDEDSNHVSENSLAKSLPWCVQLLNAGTLQELQPKVVKAYNYLVANPL